MQTNILSEFKFFNGIPIRINKKWQFILKNSWKNLFDYPIFVEDGNFYLEEGGDLTMSLSLPLVENQDGPFRDDLFMISLIAIDIKYSGDIQILLEKKINNLYFSICKIEENIFKISIDIDNNLFYIYTREIYIGAMYRKINGEYRTIH
ncbi:hypothetical protein GJV52_12670 [Neisseria brasiliensis]|uniref:hypothetical protein n=1 Tax=Neisseria TaxID=482 RepID=UPI000C275BE9|nr:MULTISPECIES: hypothetical protein [Neisseria]PJO77011.1 hypothetical protein CWC45_12805 [Neisseria sp. N177_16]QGL26305.1 hypothetical protein GJV52_12670 [Neisseria brasiliensis]